MTDFLIKSTVSMALLLAVYHLFLEREKMHLFNRFYLLFALIFSLVLPFITIEIVTKVITQPIPVITAIPVASSPITEEVNYTPYILWGIYGLVVLMLSIRFGYNLWSFLKQSYQNKTLPHKGAKLVLLNKDVLPHTFLNSIFINRQEYENRLIEQDLFTHELAHVNQKHTIDILFIEVLKTIFWFNPLLYFYKKAIQLNHEFLADESVVATTHNVISYQQLLLQKALPPASYQLASSLNFSVTKKRFTMMTKATNKGKALLLQLSALPVLAALVFFLCTEAVAKTVYIPEAPYQEITPANTKKADSTASIPVTTIPFRPIRQNVPTKKEAEGKAASKETSATATQTTITPAMYDEYMAKLKERTTAIIKRDSIINRTPRVLSEEEKAKRTTHMQERKAMVEARRDAAKQRAVAFKDRDSARQKTPRVLSDDEKVERYTMLMERKSMAEARRDAAKQRMLATKQQLEVKRKSESVSSLINTDQEDKTYFAGGLTKQPEYPGGLQELFKYFGANFKKANTTGEVQKVYVSFDIEKNGTVSNVKVIRDKSGIGLGEEAVRVLQKMQKWSPGELDGKVVRCSYNLPLTINTSK